MDLGSAQSRQLPIFAGGAAWPAPSIIRLSLSNLRYWPLEPALEIIVLDHRIGAAPAVRDDAARAPATRCDARRCVERGACVVARIVPAARRAVALFSRCILWYRSALLAVFRRTVVVLGAGMLARIDGDGA
jgi:hypothetical protein